jgi:hypothetical protein
MAEYGQRQRADHFRLSNVQCNQHNNTDPNYERRKRYGIIFQPLPALYTHDAPIDPETAEAAIATAPLAAFRGSA